MTLFPNKVKFWDVSGRGWDFNILLLRGSISPIEVSRLFYGGSNGNKNVCVYMYVYISVQFSRSVVSDSLQPHRLQHARPPCPSPTRGVYSNSWPLSQWCHATISSLESPSSAFSLSQHQGLFKWVISSHRWPKYWSFSFSICPSNEHSRLISFKMDWLDLLVVQD